MAAQFVGCPAVLIQVVRAAHAMVATFSCAVNLGQLLRRLHASATVRAPKQVASRRTGFGARPRRSLPTIPPRTAARRAPEPQVFSHSPSAGAERWEDNAPDLLSDPRQRVVHACKHHSDADLRLSGVSRRRRQVDSERCPDPTVLGCVLFGCRDQLLRRTHASAGSRRPTRQQFVAALLSRASRGRSADPTKGRRGLSLTVLRFP